MEHYTEQKISKSSVLHLQDPNEPSGESVTDSHFRGNKK